MRFFDFQEKQFRTMDFPINQKLKDFFLGGDEAWSDIADNYRIWLLNMLARKFWSLPIVELEEIIADWFHEKYVKIDAERKRAEAEGARDKLSEREISDRKIEYCTKRLGFDFARDFKGWLLKSLNNRTIDRWRKLNGGKIVYSEDNRVGELHDNWVEAKSIELKIHSEEFKRLLYAAFDEELRIYFRLWINYGGYPPGWVVSEVFNLATSPVKSACFEVSSLAALVAAILAASASFFAAFTSSDDFAFRAA